MTANRRPPSPVPHLSSLRGPISAAKWNQLIDLLAKLEVFLLRAAQDAYSGLPAPHEATHLSAGSDPLQTPADPTTVDAGSTTDVGSGPSYAYEDHEHGVTTGAASSLGEANAEGSGVALARASHIHRLDTRVALNGTVIGTRKRINIVTAPGSNVTVSDDSASDQVTVTIGGVAAQGSSESLTDWQTRMAREGYAMREVAAANFR